MSGVYVDSGYPCHVESRQIKITDAMLDLGFLHIYNVSVKYQDAYTSLRIDELNDKDETCDSYSKSKLILDGWYRGGSIKPYEKTEKDKLIRLAPGYYNISCWRKAYGVGTGSCNFELPAYINATDSTGGTDTSPTCKDNGNGTKIDITYDATALKTCAAGVTETQFAYTVTHTPHQLIDPLHKTAALKCDTFEKQRAELDAKILADMTITASDNIYINNIMPLNCTPHTLPTPTPTATPAPPLPPCAEWGTGTQEGVCLKVATSLFQGGTPGAPGSGNISTDPGQFIIRIFTIILGFAGGIALLLIISAGYKIIMSKGKPEGIQQGRDQLIAAIVGLIFIIFSFVIFQLVVTDILKIPGIAK
jgi:hypothetical protein